MAKTQRTGDSAGARYEYRVWGRHRGARKTLAKIADEQTTEIVDDCYLLVDDPSWNVKIRDNTLKLKRLVAERKGFEQWRADRHECSETAPWPFDAIFDRLAVDRLQDGDDVDLSAHVTAVAADTGIRAVFVTKRRRRYRVGDLRAESTDITLHESGEVLHTLSIEGDDLEQLRVLRKRLGLRGEDNVAVHQALEFSSLESSS